MTVNHIDPTDIVPARAVVVYHADCMDGISSAWAFKYLAADDYKAGVSYYPLAYGDSPSILGIDMLADLFILDFSFNRATLLDLSDKFASVTVLDHHKTAAAELEGWDNKPSNVEIVFDMERSGAGITWDYLSENEERPELISYVEEYDLGKTFKGTATISNLEDIIAFIAIHDKNLETWDRLVQQVETALSAVMRAGELLNKSFKKHVESIVQQTVRPFQIKGYHALVCNCPAQFASAVGNELAKRSGTFGATYYTAADNSTKFSLRSIGDFDVAAIAHHFGGGGHKNAAGFTLSAPTEIVDGVTVWDTNFGELTSL